MEATSANPPAQLHDDGAAEHSTPDPARPPTADAETKNEAAQRRAGERHAQLAAAAGEKGTLRGKPGAWRPVLEIRDPAGFVFELEAGTRPPVVLLAGGPDLSPAQAQAVERIATDFSKEVQRASTQSTDDAGLAQAWDDARKRADERYHILIGNDAYLQASIRAMRETWQLSGAR